jgi:hypothetical protein
MRLNAFAAGFAALVSLAVVIPDYALADGASNGDRERRVRHASRAHYVFKVDPYAYQYSPRGYYPYYGSAYWSPTAYVRQRDRLHYNVWNTQPPRYAYYPSWGYPRAWNNRAWHEEHHGRHRPWHW